MENSKEERRDNSTDESYLSLAMVNEVNVSGSRPRTVFSDSFARKMRGSAAIRARRFSRFNLSNIFHVVGHFSRVDGAMAATSRCNCGPALNAFHIGFDDHRVFRTNFSDATPGHIDTRERILDSNSRISHMKFWALQENVKSKYRGATNDKNSKEIIIGVRDAGVGEKSNKNVSSEGAVQRSFGSKNFDIPSGIYQFAKLRVSHE